MNVFKTNDPRGWLSLVAVLGAIGCSIDPPVPLERDPEHRALARAIPHRLALAPVTRSYLEGRPGRTWPTLGAGSDRRAPRWASREYTWTAPVDAKRLRSRFARVLGWAFQREGRVLPLAGGAEAAALRSAAEALHADLLIDIDVTGCRASWVERDGLAWWGNFALFYGLGIPIPFIADEVYEVELRARVGVVHVRSGRRILDRRFRVTERRSLNEPERGWTLSGFLFLYPYLLDEDDFGDVQAALYPHAQKQLELAVVRWLATALPKRLNQPPVRELIVAGDPQQARTYALVLGANGPQSDAVDRPRPLLRAVADAQSVSKTLVETRLVASPSRVSTLVGAGATPAAILAEVRRLGRRMLGNDQLLIYYAGYGRTDGKGNPHLLLDRDTLSLSALASAVRASVPDGAKVGFLLDTSFGGVRGRTYPGGRQPSTTEMLAALDDASWSTIAASGPRHSALELGSDPHGLFTRFLIEGLVHQSDASGRLRFKALQEFVAPRVDDEARDRVSARQRPQLQGEGDLELGPPARLRRAGKRVE